MRAKTKTLAEILNDGYVYPQQNLLCDKSDERVSVLRQFKCPLSRFGRNRDGEWNNYQLRERKSHEQKIRKTG